VYVTLPDGPRVGYRFDPVPEGAALGTLWRLRFVADPGVFDVLSVESVPLQLCAMSWAALRASPIRPVSI
jgi:hypothetical protein